MSFAEEVLDLTASRPPTLGAGRLICVDGPAGSGKTTLSRVLGRSDPRVKVVHMDALYEGWDGLPRVGVHVQELLGPLAAGSPGSYRRYDWDADAYAESVTVPPGPLLVLEGVGSGGRAWAHLTTTLVWVEAPTAGVRLARGIARDGVGVTDRWLQFMATERAMFATEGTRARADLLLST